VGGSGRRGTCASTTARLVAAGEAGTLTAFDALTLQEAFELVCQLRLDHQVAQLQAGVEPDDFLAPSELNPFTPSYLKEAFRAVASVQRHISTSPSGDVPVPSPDGRVGRCDGLRPRAGRGRTPWRLAHFCVVDLELSGLNSDTDEIISFAAVPIDAARVVAGNAVCGLCKNTHLVPEASVVVHGIRTVDLADAPPLHEAIKPLVDILAGRVLVAHAAWIERWFLTPVLRRHGVRLRGPILDTRDLGELLALERGVPLATASLSGLARSLGLPVHRPHHALGDALTAAQAFIALATHLDEFAPQTVRSLADARKRKRTRMFRMYPGGAGWAGGVASSRQTGCSMYPYERTIRWT